MRNIKARRTAICQIQKGVKIIAMIKTAISVDKTMANFSLVKTITKKNISKKLGFVSKMLAIFNSWRNNKNSKIKVKKSMRFNMTIVKENQEQEELHSVRQFYKEFLDWHCAKDYQ